MQGNQCIAVLRSQLGFGGERPRKLNEFVAAVLENRKFYNLIAVARFPKRSAEYFANQLECVRENYGKVTSHEEFAEQSFFCTAFVVACYAVVGIIGETAQAAYQPNNFSPGHLGEDPTSDGSWAILCQKVGSWQSRHNVARVRSGSSGGGPALLVTQCHKRKFRGLPAPSNLVTESPDRDTPFWVGCRYGPRSRGAHAVQSFKTSRVRHAPRWRGVSVSRKERQRVKY